MHHKIPSFFKFTTLKCNPLCAPTNHVLYRIHASCLWCRLRMWYYKGKFINGFYNNLVIPDKSTVISIQLQNGFWYCLVNDDMRKAAHFKNCTQKLLYRIAARIHYPEISKYAYLLIEFLAT